MNKSIYIDVDDTLVRTAGTKRIPITHMVEFVKQLSDAGLELYCWSTAGRTYARASAEDLGIADCFVAFLTKPKFMIDDTFLADWSLHQVHPNSCRGISVEEFLGMF